MLNAPFAATREAKSFVAKGHVYQFIGDAFWPVFRGVLTPIGASPAGVARGPGNCRKPVQKLNGERKARKSAPLLAKSLAFTRATSLPRLVGTQERLEFTVVGVDCGDRAFRAFSLRRCRSQRNYRELRNSKRKLKQRVPRKWQWRRATRATKARRNWVRPLPGAEKPRLSPPEERVTAYGSLLVQ